MSKQFFVTGIDTEIGKTVISAILVQALKADYWKPVQSGDLDHSDSMKVANWNNNFPVKIHQETYRLTKPMSPHASAALDGVEIKIPNFFLPKTDNNLIVEGAGGLLVPLNDRENIIDLMIHLKIPVILVSKNYLGSINHTLLSIEALKRREIPIAGIVFNGKENKTTEEIICKRAAIPVLFKLEELSVVNAESIQKKGDLLRSDLIKTLNLNL